MPDKTIDILSKEVSGYRVGVSYAEDEVKIDKSDPDNITILGVSLITRGEALGHSEWIDTEFLSAVAEAANSKAGRGLKARFTHPSLSADGTGKYLGYYTNARVDGDQVLADLHLSKAAKKSPDGDLVEYVTLLAEYDPDMFGTSIVFERDLDAEDALIAQYQVDGKGFVSPDKDNQNNYTHCRLAKLRACDVVDDPAANPGGLFSSGQDIAKEADLLASYVIGNENAECPTFEKLPINPDRAKQFFARYLQNNGLEIVNKEPEAMSDENKVEDKPKEKTADEFRADFLEEQKKYTEKFGAERGLEYFNSGKGWEAALEAELSFSRETITKRDKTIADQEEKFAQLNMGEEEGAEFGDSESKKPKGLESVFSVPGS